MSKREGIRYRDTIAAPGSELYKALVESKESPSHEGRVLAAARAKKVWESEREYRRWNP